MSDKTRTEDLEKKVSDLISLVQGKIDKGATKSEVDELAQKAVDAHAELQAFKTDLEAKNKRIDELEKLIARGHNGSVSDQKLDQRYRSAFNRYLRKGTPVPDELKTEFHTAFINEFSSGLSESEVKTEVAKLNDWCDIENGFFYLPDAKTMLAGMKGQFEGKTLQVGVEPDGGYFVQPERLSRTVDRFFESSAMRQICTVQGTANESVEMIIDDDEAASGGWVTEIGARNNTNTPKIGRLTIHTHEQYAQPLATQKMLDDAGFNIEAWLSEKVKDIITRTENTAFVSGDGANKPYGFLSYPIWAVAGTYEREKIERVNSGGVGTFTADSLLDLQFQLKEVYEKQAVWAMRRATLREVFQLKESGTGAYLINRELLRQGAPIAIFGQPVYQFSDMPAVAGAADAIAYGDFKKGYMIVDRIGFRVLRDPYTTKPYVKFYTTKRVGGAVTNYEAIKIMRLSA